MLKHHNYNIYYQYSKPSASELINNIPSTSIMKEIYRCTNTNFKKPAFLILKNYKFVILIILIPINEQKKYDTQTHHIYYK